MHGGSIAYAEAIERLNAIAETWAASTAAEEPRYAKLSEAVGCISAQDVLSTRFLPPYDNSAMDGYAVTSGDSSAATVEQPVRFRVLRSIAAGDPPPRYTNSQSGSPHKPDLLPVCYRINTGSPFPLPIASTSSSSQPHLQQAQSDILFDACARIEIVKQISDDVIEITAPVKTRQHRRNAGEDIQPGMQLLRKGQRIRTGDIACLASSGIRRVKVVRKPRIAILTTGKELQNPEIDGDDEELGEGQIFNSNGPYIRAALRDWGHEDAVLLGSVGDDPEDYKARIKEQVSGQYDVLITTGGVSKGQHDYVKDTLVALDASILFHGVGIRPGHPVLTATLPSSSSIPLVVFSLPGNPIAAAACLRFLVSPYLLKSMGAPPEKPFLRAALVLAEQDTSKQHQASMSRNGRSVTTSSVARMGPRCFLLAQYTLSENSESAVLQVTPLAKGSGMVRPLSQANCWMILEEGQQEESGKVVNCWSMSPR